MGLDKFLEDSRNESTSQVQSSYIEFENPNHPDSKDFDDPERALQYFQAARWLQQEMGSDRVNLVGTFIHAVKESQENDNNEPLENLVERLKK